MGHPRKVFGNAIDRDTPSSTLETDPRDLKQTIRRRVTETKNKARREA